MNKPISQYTPSEHREYRRNLARRKRGVLIPGLCEVPGCDRIKYSMSGNCRHCLPCKTRLLNENAARFQREYVEKNGHTYYKAQLMRGFV